MVDLDYYEYKIYLASDGTETALKARASTIDGAMVSGITKSNLVVISDLDNTTLVGSTLTTLSYRAKVRAVNTAGNVGAFSAASASADTQLIGSQFVQDLTAGKITAGTIGAHEIILTQPGTQTSYTPPNGTAVLRSSNYVTGGVGVGAGWIIKGDGTAEFDAASIRGTLSANAIFINANNRWARDSANSVANSEFVVGDATNQLSFNPTGGATSGSLLKVGNSSNFMKFDNGVLTVTGAITTNANITGSTAGGLTIGTDSIQFGSGGYGSSIFFVGRNAGVDKFSIGSKLVYDSSVGGGTLTITGAINATSGTINDTLTVGTVNSTIKIVGTATASSTAIYSGTSSYGSGGFWLDASGRFSLSDKLTFNGNNLTINGTVTIGSTTASTVVSNAQTGAGALQAGPGVTQNSSTKQITQISGTGVTITSNGNTTLNRVQLDSNGLKAYNSVGTETVAINSDGTATFTGTVTGSVLQNATSNQTFMVKANGNVFANNIYATGSSATDRRTSNSL